MNTQLNLLLTEFTRAIPHIVGAILVLLIGYLVARITGNIVGGGLHRLGLDRLVEGSPGGSMVKRMTASPAKLRANKLFRWLSWEYCRLRCLSWVLRR